MAGKKKLIAALAPLVVIGSVLVTAAPAQASSSQCPSGYACNWRDSSYSVYMTPFLTSKAVYDNNDMHDKISSVYNNGTSSTVRFYKDENYGGTWFPLSIGTGDADLSNSVGNAPSGFNDSIDSGKFI